jgi:GNAT superfamily N-acetyltransferase
MTGPALRVSSDKRELDVDMIHTFLSEQAPWAKGMPRETLERAIEGSLCFGAYLGAQQIGFARVVTDMATFAYLCDVFILPEFRSKGHAAALMARMFESEVFLGMRRIVLVTSDAHELYRPVGFSNLASTQRYMEIHRPHVYEN